MKDVVHIRSLLAKGSSCIQMVSMCNISRGKIGKQHTKGSKKEQRGSSLSLPLEKMCSNNLV